MKIKLVLNVTEEQLKDLRGEVADLDDPCNLLEELSAVIKQGEFEVVEN